MWWFSFLYKVDTSINITLSHEKKKEMAGPASEVRNLNIYTGTPISTPPNPINAYPNWYNSDSSASSSTSEVVTKSIGAGLNSISNSSAGNQANYRIPYGKLSKRISKRFWDSYHVGQIIVTKCNSSKRPSRGKRRYAMMNIPMFNFYVASLQKKPSKFSDICSPEYYWRDWSVDGIAMSVTPQNSNSRSYVSEETGEKLINLIQAGPILTYNVFGHVKPGTRLYLIFKKVKKPANYNVVHDRLRDVTTTPYAEGADSDEEEEQLTDLPYQLIPWGDYKYDYPPSNVTDFVDEFGVRRSGLVMFIGLSNTESISLAENTASWYSVDSIGRNAIQFEMMIDIRPC
jgi:hypothetical protein